MARYPSGMIHAVKLRFPISAACLAMAFAAQPAFAYERVSPSFHDASCKGQPSRTRAIISNGSLVVIGASMADSYARSAVTAPPVIDAELRDLADQPPVRVVGPSFRPAPEAAIDLRVPGRIPGR